LCRQMGADRPESPGSPRAPTLPDLRIRLANNRSTDPELELTGSLPTRGFRDQHAHGHVPPVAGAGPGVVVMVGTKPTARRLPG
jgi:hypothetical protein